MKITDPEVQLALKEMDEDKIMALIPEMEVDSVNAGGRTLITYCAERGWIEAVNKLIENKANINLRSSIGNTALGYAISQSGGAIWDRYSNLTESFKEMRSKCTEVAKILIDAEADVRGWHDYSSLLFNAAALGNKELVQKLLEKGADPNVGSGDWTPLIRIIDLDFRDIAEILIEGGADLNLQNHRQHGMTPLLYAIRKGRTEMVRILINAGAKIDLGDRFGHKPLYEAIFKDIEILEALINGGANLDLPDKQGATATMQAINYGRMENAKVLIKAGANLNLEDRNNQTALMHALRINNTEIIEKLKEKGAKVSIKGYQYLLERFKDYPQFIKSFENTAIQQITEGIKSNQCDPEKLPYDKEFLLKLQSKDPDNHELKNTIDTIDSIIAKYSEPHLKGAQGPIYPTDGGIIISDMQNPVASSSTGTRSKLADTRIEKKTTLRQGKPIDYVPPSQEVLTGNVLKNVISYLPPSDIESLQQVPNAKKKHIKTILTERAKKAEESKDSTPRR